MLNVPTEADAHVLLLDDDATPFEFVVELLTSVFGKSELDAKIIASLANEHGEALCGTWPRNVSHALLDAARRRILEGGHTLSFVLRTDDAAGTDHCGFCGRSKSQGAAIFKRKSCCICDRCLQAA